jgi:putative toxin-antitoxin system antitoxin component (TIGR02293 family)
MEAVSFKPAGRPDHRQRELDMLGALLAASVSSQLDLADMALERIDASVIDRFVRHGMRPDELTFIIPRRTLSHRREHGERLSAEESDKAIRLAKIIAQAEATFVSHDKAMHWLRQVRRRFGDRSALDLVSTEHGARLVEETLIQVDEGYAA